MVKLERIAPELPVTNLAESLAYYKSRLGFDIVSEWPDGNYAIVQRDNIAIHLFQDRSSSQPVGIHIFTSGLDHLHDQFATLGATITQGIERKPWGNRDFRVADPSGNQLKFTEPSAED